MTAQELRQKFLNFFKEKGHAIIPSASLIPENDPTVKQETLFISAGMQPLIPFFLGKKHPTGDKLVDIQKCVRVKDIEEVSDNRHLTFFEMLGNWSLGNYFKEKAIEWSFEFLTDKKWLGLDPKRIYVSVFKGEDGIPKDEESIRIWQEVFKKAGIKSEVAGEDAVVKSNIRIVQLGKEDNFWIAGEVGPCGLDTEMYYDTRPEEGEINAKFQDLVDSFRLIEIWNNVFIEFNKTAGGKYEKLNQKNVDTGMGLERPLAVLNGKKTVFDTELFRPIIEKIEKISGKKYKGNEKAMRIIADHIKASLFIIAEGIEPLNVQRGYVLRRLIRRAVRQGHALGVNNNFTAEVAKAVQEIYKSVYPEVNKENILNVLEKEEDKFRKTLSNGLNKLEKFLSDPEGYWIRKKDQKIQKADMYSNEKLAAIIFDLYQTYGFPLELSLEEFKNRNIKIEEDKIKIVFNRELQKHQELSRTASAGMFKGGLADNKEKTTELHTTAHLMLAGLRKVLGPNVHQKGSNINGERIRFDFSHPEKLTAEQKKAVEDFVNKVIQAKIEVKLEEMSPENAKAAGAEGEFGHKYGDKIKVYTIEGYSKEICGGPHVKNTGDIKGRFRITKEESSSAGVRRIKAVVE